MMLFKDGSAALSGPIDPAEAIDLMIRREWKFRTGARPWCVKRLGRCLSSQPDLIAGAPFLEISVLWLTQRAAVGLGDFSTDLEAAIETAMRKRAREAGDLYRLVMSELLVEKWPELRTIVDDYRKAHS